MSPKWEAGNAEPALGEYCERARGTLHLIALYAEREETGVASIVHRASILWVNYLDEGGILMFEPQGRVLLQAQSRRKAYLPPLLALHHCYPRVQNVFDSLHSSRSSWRDKITNTLACSCRGLPRMMTFTKADNDVSSFGGMGTAQKRNRPRQGINSNSSDLQRATMKDRNRQMFRPVATACILSVIWSSLRRSQGSKRIDTCRVRLST